ncbi:hypothetical protein AOQ84DRAFT_229298 [Glonium stellatum]|uniref:Uncharacterized protein n=1 Tax=Glonium stellatum TaxID=574774 RepID=A0A8E2F704_9PEZI|nr:hypothetical protein AOQ84DRAFT_229298 [Glonium stellatum]
MSPSYGKPINHQRRPSARRSFSAASPIPSSPKIESPRTLCPRDGDAFSYNPAHLPVWYMPPDLWARLPSQLLASLAAMQHAGAAVLTGFERLENLSGSLDSVTEETAQTAGSELEDCFDTITKQRTSSDSSSSRHDSGFSSPLSTSPTSSISSSPLLSSHHSGAPITPLSLPPTIDSDAQDKSNRRRAFTTPLDPHNSYYTAELSYLRTDSLPRLRHSARKVETTLAECRRADRALASLGAEFEAWWVGKKQLVSSLNDKGKTLGMSMGAGGMCMGWRGA